MIESRIDLTGVEGPHIEIPTEWGPLDLHNFADFVELRYQELRIAAEGEGFHWLLVQTIDAVTESDLVKALSDGFRCPTNSIEDWDDLTAALRDLSWLPGRWYVCEVPERRSAPPDDAGRVSPIRDAGMGSQCILVGPPSSVSLGAAGRYPGSNVRLRLDRRVSASRDLTRPDFYLALSEGYGMEEPRRGFVIRRPRGDSRDDYLLARIEPPVIG
jgi:hypothetical protein